MLVQNNQASSFSEDYSSIVNGIQQLASGHYQYEFNESHELADSLNQLADFIRSRASKHLDQIVELSMEASETTILTANMLSNIREVDGEAQGIASAAEQLSSTANEIRSQGREIDAHAKQSETLTLQGNEVSLEAQSAFEAISVSVSDSSEKVATLQSFTDQISTIAESVKKIADNTSLLAINASIEAARAGEAGKGFAVVADEVQRLSGDTKNAVLRINEITDRLVSEAGLVSASMANSERAVHSGREKISSVMDNMSQIRLLVEKMSASTAQINHSLDEQTDASEAIADSVTKIAEKSSASLALSHSIAGSMDRIEAGISVQIKGFEHIDLAKRTVKLAQSDHLIWKRRLANMLEGREGLNPNELADQHSCRLGKWYDSLKGTPIANSDVYRKLEAPHRRVHQNGIAAAQLYTNKQFHAALQKFEEMNQDSIEVIRLLKQLEQSPHL